eukprot:Pompholyxophrys_punicea_v1_NODE_765_length_1323_cov_14.661672.p1 type:complete len:157 gc:universal NODE_765_length_1323_cov_14.661672:441-911(+)
MLIVVVPDYPGNIYTRKLHYLTSLRKLPTVVPVRYDMNQIFELVISVLGPLHVSLNVRELVIMKYVDCLWLPFYRSIFGENKKLAKKPKPWRISLILELADGGWKLIRDNILQFFKDCCDPIYALILHIINEIVPAALNIYSTFFFGVTICVWIAT